MNKAAMYWRQLFGRAGQSRGFKGQILQTLPETSDSNYLGKR